MLLLLVVVIVVVVVVVTGVCDLAGHKVQPNSEVCYIGQRSSLKLVND